MKTELDDLAVKKAVEQLGLKPHQKGQPAQPKGSGTKVVETTTKPLAPVKTKKFSVELTAEQEARCAREAAVMGVSVKDYLQNLVDKKLAADIGRKLIGGSTWMSGGGEKVIAPTNTFGRDV